MKSTIKSDDKPSFLEYLEIYKDVSFSANGEKLAGREILAPLMKSDEEYQRFYNSIFKNEDIVGISLESYYKLLNYTFNKTISGRYIIPTMLENRVNELITSLEVVINYFKEQENVATKSLEKVKINEELKNTILKDLDESLTPLEKAIYIYLKLCKYLTYDVKFYLTGGELEEQEHQTLDDVSNISLEKNSIVCYDFNMLYAKFLQDLGLKPVIFGREKVYSESHETLEVLFSNLILSADSTTSFFKNDLTNAKLGLPFKGLKCLTKNTIAQKEFNEALNKVYEIFKKEEKIEFDSLIKEYQILNSLEFKISLKERVEIMCSALTSSSLIDMDLMSYALELKNILFSKEELKENIFFTSLGMRKEKDLSLVAILAFNENGFKIRDKDTIYYLYNQESFEKITKEEILSLVLNEELECNNKLKIFIGDVYDDREIKRNKC